MTGCAPVTPSASEDEDPLEYKDDKDSKKKKKKKMKKKMKNNRKDSKDLKDEYNSQSRKRSMTNLNTKELSKSVGDRNVEYKRKRTEHRHSKA